MMKRRRWQQVGMSVVAALVAAHSVVGDANAQPSAEASQRRKAAELAYEAAVRGGAIEDYERCGQAYLATIDEERITGHVDEAMYKAAVCFEDARSAGAALMLYDQLEREAPASQRMRATMARGAALRERIGDLAGAADRYERYSARYAAADDAPEALVEAFVLRRALGDVRSASADAERFIKQYGAHAPARAADLILVLAHWAHERGDEALAISHYQRYLREWSSKDNRVRALASTARLGELMWRQSCPVPLIAGVCARVIKPGKSRHCGATTLIDPVPRDPAKAKEAATTLGRVRSEYEQQPLDHPVARHAYARALLQKLDADIEAALALPSIPATGFADRQRLADWYNDLRKHIAKPIKTGRAVMAVNEPHTHVAAAMRLAWLWTVAADRLSAPPIIRATGDHLVDDEHYCRAMEALAESLRTEAEGGAKVCLDLAHELSVVDDATATCVALADRWQPELALRERVPAATAATATLQLAP